MATPKITAAKSNGYVIAELELQQSIPTVPEGNVLFAGWSQIRWPQLMSLADELILLSSKMLERPKNQFLQQQFERIEGKNAIGGVAILLTEGRPIDESQAVMLQNAFDAFLRRLLGKLDSSTADLVEAERLPSETIAKINACVKDSLQMVGGRRIASSMIVKCRDMEHQVSGKHAPKPIAQKQLEKYAVVARIEGYDRESRICNLQIKSTGKYQKVGFEVGLFLDELRQRCCDNRCYELALAETMDVKGRLLTVLTSIGGQVEDAEVLFIGHG